MSETIAYYAGGRLRRLDVQGLFDSRQVRDPSPGTRQAFRVAPQRMGPAIAATMAAEPRLGEWFEEPDVDRALIAPVDKGRTTVIPTGGLVIEGTKAAVRTRLQREHGAEIVREGRERKHLLLMPGPPAEAAHRAADVSRQLVEGGDAAAAYPNFLRVLQRPGPSTTEATGQWNLDNDGTVGLVGADVHAEAAWTITEGDREVRVAVLDEGVEMAHPMLAAAAAGGAEKDFVGDGDTAMPDGDDAHGTACAGIVASDGDGARGLAPGVSLVGARIARSDTRGFWIFDDFQTADAIDWCWREAEADVLSNSWGGGGASDAIINAVGRARTNGRGGKGAVVVFAAGNTQQRIGFPATIDGVLVVGASNQWDARKTRTSKDGEDFWGSNFGPPLGMMAPGVSITTTDISGAPGYTDGDTTSSFNGTSSATPHVSAAAALMLSVNPGLTEARVRELLRRTADPIAGTANEVGSGRLNAYAAVRAARRG